MSESLLLTKLYIPPPRLKVILRPRLIERLNEVINGKLCLVSAPAGFGKTTLVAEWVAGCGRPVAWLSLDEGDHDPTRFMTYFVAALQTILPKLGEGVLGLLQSPQPPAIESILTSLLNEISAVSEHFVLVLDDYHAMDSRPVDELLTFLMDHLPAPMHLLIATREDPPLPLARLRVRGQLTELRAADLRFTPAEATDFLNQVMHLNLTTDDVSALEMRTEGWIAGLQLAALAMQSREDVPDFIKAFTGSHRFVLDYLFEEVLQHQSEQIRSFLLQTAILGKLCAALCNAVTEREDGKEMLDVLERSNLFLIPLDDQRQWYRYHHLFAEVLLAHLMEAQPEQIVSLHQRASVWYELNGYRADAVQHALAARDFERAAGLIELAWAAMDVSYQSIAWLGWVRKLPVELFHTRPVLSVGYAWALLDGGELEASEALLQDAECCLQQPMEKIVVVDKEQFRSLPASIATAWAYRSLALGNVADTVKYARQGLELTPADDQTRTMQAISLMGIAQYTNGDLESAERSLAEFCLNLQKTGEIPTLIGITFLLANIRVALGHLHEAENIYQQTLRLATSQSEPIHLGIADLYRGLSELCVERNDLETAAQYLLTIQKMGDQSMLTDWQYRLCVSQARLKEAQGDLDDALALLDEAERVHIRGPLPDVRPLAALKTRVWLKQGRLAEAQRWVREQGLSPEDDLCFVHEFEHITLARVLLAAGQSNPRTAALDQAARLLDRLLQAAEAGGRVGSVIQILLLQALVFQVQDNLPHAMQSLERAVVLADPQGFMRTFVDEGEAVRLLFEKQSSHRNHPLNEYAASLLSAFTQPATPQPAIHRQSSGLIEPLSERELEVLRLLRSELSGPEIAQQLIVSLNTLRTHTKNIFNKLGVNNRRTAVRRAEELDLF